MEALRGGSPVEQLVEHGADRVDVRGGGDLLAPRLLRREIAGRAEDGALEREPRALVTDGDPEVAELEHSVAAEQEVLRLHVPVDETGGVGGRERRAHLDTELRRFGRRQRPVARDELRERLPLDVLHCDEGTALVLADVEDPHDVGMRQPRRETGLADEAPPQVLVPSEVLRQPLERHGPVELDVLGEVDGGHRAVAERPDELVAAGDERHAHGWFPPGIAVLAVVRRLGRLVARRLRRVLGRRGHGHGARDPVGQGIRALDERLLEAYGHPAFVRDDLVAQGGGELRCPAVLSGGGRARDRRRSSRPRRRQRTRQPAVGPWLWPGAAAAGCEEGDERREREDPQHLPACTRHRLRRSVAFPIGSVSVKVL